MLGMLEWDDGMLEGFEPTLQRAINGGYDKLVVKSGARISTTIVIKCKNKQFIIEGMGQSIVIEGSGHSVFQITGKGSCIILKNLQVNHTAMARDKRDIGGAVFVMGKARSILEDCRMTSSYGFGIWGVQSARISLMNCYVSSGERSGGVLFGTSSLSVDSSHITQCGQHGLCVRGSVNLTISNSLIDHCRIRGIYAYDKSHVSITSSTISFTQSEQHSAVEFWGGVSPPSVDFSQQLNDSIQPLKCLPERRFRRSSSPDRDLLATLENVLFISNKGNSIRCQGKVQIGLLDCFYYSPSLDLCCLFAPKLINDTASCPYHEPEKIIWRVSVDQIELNLPRPGGHENSSRFLQYFSTSHQAIRWAYLRGDSEWIEFDRPELHSYLSTRYHQYISSALSGSQEQDRLTILPEPYNIYRIDFQKLEQTNVDTHFARSIRWSTKVEEVERIPTIQEVLSSQDNLHT
jgi:hypothetical protein